MKIRLDHLRLVRPLVALDAETTGLDPSTDRIVEIAALRLNPGAVTTAFHTLVNPGVPIPLEASKVHAIYDRDVQERPRFESIAHELYAFLLGADLVAYNAGFDLAVLTAEFARVHLRFKVQGRAVLDPLIVFRTREPRSLGQ